MLKFSQVIAHPLTTDKFEKCIGGKSCACALYSLNVWITHGRAINHIIDYRAMHQPLGQGVRDRSLWTTRGHDGVSSKCLSWSELKRRSLHCSQWSVTASLKSSTPFNETINRAHAQSGWNNWHSPFYTCKLATIGVHAPACAKGQADEVVIEEFYKRLCTSIFHHYG